MRRPSRHLPDADIDAGLAEIDRIELRMGVGEVQDPRVAEPLEVVDARGCRRARASRGRPGEIAAAVPAPFRKSRRRMAISNSPRPLTVRTFGKSHGFSTGPQSQRISIAFQASFSDVAWKIDAFASASASFAAAIARSKSPPSARLLGGRQCRDGRGPLVAQADGFLRWRPRRRHRPPCSRLRLRARRRRERATRAAWRWQVTALHGRAPGPEIGRPLAT